MGSKHGKARRRNERANAGSVLGDMNAGIYDGAQKREADEQDFGMIENRGKLQQLGAMPEPPPQTKLIDTF